MVQSALGKELLLKLRKAHEINFSCNAMQENGLGLDLYFHSSSEPGVALGYPFN